MPSTAKTVYDVGFVDPYQTTNKEQNQWFKNVVLGNINAYNDAVANYEKPTVTGLGGNIGSNQNVGWGVNPLDGSLAPAPKYYNWLVQDLLKQYGKGETDPQKVWSSLTADQKDKLVADVGTRAMKDENAGSFLGNLLIKPTMPLSLIGPFNAIPGAAGTVAGVGITSSGGIGTILSNPVVGELGTGVVTGGAAAGGVATGGGGDKPTEPKPGEEEEPPTVGGGGNPPVVGVEPEPSVAPDKDDERPDRYIPPVVGVEPGTIPDEEPEEEDPPIVVPPDDPPPTGTEPEPPSDPFSAAIGNLGIFHGQAGLSRKPYVNVDAPAPQNAPRIQHSALVEQALAADSVPRPTSSTQRQASPLGLASGVVPPESSQNESSEESALSKLRRRRRGLGIG